MPARHRADPAMPRQAVLAPAGWSAGGWVPGPVAVGEARGPRCVAVQGCSGPRHTRGTPPSVVETDARTWLLLATGMTSLPAAQSAGAVSLSGSRAGEIEHWLPLFDVS